MEDRIVFILWVCLHTVVSFRAMYPLPKVTVAKCDTVKSGIIKTLFRFFKCCRTVL